jgi:tRNA nucleotidyltransferase (CCA-adding enzyme)
VIERLHAERYAAFMVGGCVRDIVRGVAPKDYDVATSAHPRDVMRVFKKVIPTGIQHGTVTVLEHGDPIEVTTFRTEGAYVDGRRPTSVEFKQEIRDDLSRRDFTINAMAFDPARHQLVDPFEGARDLEARTLRCVGSAFDRFSEDGLRALRAVRFAVVLDFKIEPATLAAIPRTLEVFRKVSRERIRVELEKILHSPRCGTGLGLLHSTGLLGEFLPEADGPDYADRVAAAQNALALEVRLAAWLAQLKPAQARESLRRLTFPNKVSDRVALLLEHPAPAPDADDHHYRRWLSAIGTEAAREAGELAVARGAPEELRHRIDALLSVRHPVSAKDLALDGEAIMRVLAVGPSRAVGDATRFLLAQVLEDPARNSEPALTELLRKWAKSRGL